MAKANETGGISGIFARLLAKASPADLKDMLQDAALNKSFENIDAGAEPLMAADFVKDQFAGGNVDTVITAEEVKVGPNQAATGGNVDRQIAHYSPNQAPQHGYVEQSTQIGRLVSRMGSMEKAIHAIHQHVSLLSAGVVQTLEKSIAADAVAVAVGKSDAAVLPLQPAEATGAGGAGAAPVVKGENPFGKKDEEDKDDEKAKSLMVGRANTEFVAAKGLIAKAEELEGDGLAGSAKSRRTEAEASLAKARTLLGAAGALGAAGDEFDRIAKAIDVFAKAKSLAKADDKTDEDEDKAKAAAKALAASTEDPVAKAEEAALAKMAEIQKALDGLAVMKSDVQSVLSMVAGQSRVGGGVPDRTALAKGDPLAYARAKSAEVMAMQDEGVMSNDDVMAAHDILGKMQAATKGLVPATTVTERIRGSSSVVRSLFQDAA
jgi:hypothetical protein